MRKVLLALVSCLLATSSLQAYPYVQRFMVEMPDGVRLATDVYYPQVGEGPWPVMLYRTPYGIYQDEISEYAEDGWVAVCQDTRGRWDSEGEDLIFMADGWGPNHTDGKDTVDWLLAREWCDGRIATIGSSARGITQNMLAGALPDSLRCQFVVVAPADMYKHTVFPGGAFRYRDVMAWLQGNGSMHFLDSLVAHPNYDEYWRWADTSTRDSLITVPTYQVGGWFDLFCEGTIAKFRGLQEGGGEGAQGMQKLLIGPWTHAGGSGQLYYPGDDLYSAYDLIGSETEWFTRWIDGSPNGIMTLPHIAYYLMGDADDPAAPGNEWLTADSWPPPSTEFAVYLREGEKLDIFAAQTDEAPDSFLFDPLDPVPTIGGNNLVGAQGPYDQSSVEIRDDVLLYTSDALTSPLTIVGPVRLRLFASSSCVDTDFTAKLSDVYPDGRSMLVCDGILRARHRLSWETEDFLTPGEIYEFDILLGQTAQVFNTGHRMRLAVSSSNWDRFDVNPNTGAPWGGGGSSQIAQNVVHHDTAYPSHLLMRFSGDLSDVAFAPAGKLQMLGAHPNPFNPQATICFVLDAEAVVSGGVYDLRGRRVRELLAPTRLTEGRHDLIWDGRDQSGATMASGLYLARIDTGSEQTSCKLVLLK